MFSRLLRTLYGGLWKAAIPLLKHHKRLKTGFDERLVPDDWPSQDFHTAQKQSAQSPTLWLQAASGGEATLLFPLLEALWDNYQKNHPATPLPLFLCTTCTEQGMDIIAKHTQALPESLRERVWANYFPLDAPAMMRKAIHQVCPHLVVLLETELWPGLMHELKRTHTPYCIANARMTEKTFRSYQKAKSFFTRHRPQRIIATTAENANRFEQVFHMKPTIAPNIKFDIIARQLQLRDTHADCAEFARMVSLLGRPNNSPQSVQSSHANPAQTVVPPLIALASVRQEEEDQLTAVVEMICHQAIQGMPCLCLLAPRHLHRIPFWRQWFEKTNIAYVLKSELRHPLPNTTRCILWDTFGEFNLLYALADTAFVGGSLAPLGGQNFLEPLSQGTSTVIGPSWSNFAWVGKELFSAGLVCEQNTALETGKVLLDKVAALLASPRSQWAHDRKAGKERVRSALRNIIDQNTGGSEKTAAALCSLLKSGVCQSPSDDVIR